VGGRLCSLPDGGGIWEQSGAVIFVLKSTGVFVLCGGTVVGRWTGD